MLIAGERVGFINDSVISFLSLSYNRPVYVVFMFKFDDHEWVSIDIEASK